MKTIIILFITILSANLWAEDLIAIKVSPEKICKDIKNETEQIFCNEIKGQDVKDEDFIFLPSQLARIKDEENLDQKYIASNKVSIDLGDDFVSEGNTQDYPDLSKWLAQAENNQQAHYEKPSDEVILLRKYFGKLTDGKTPNSLSRQTGHLFIIGVGFMGVLLNLPPSIVKWDEDEKIDPTRLFKKYFDNIKNGPVVDNDDWMINYIGHPVSGAWYYTMARDLGLSPTKSFLYSAVMSTFFWEYGIEAFAEKPSLQDLIVTPVVGALMGEVFWQLNKKIIANGYDHTILGGIAQFLMNPAGMTGNGIHYLLQKVGSNVEVNTSFKIVPRTNYIERDSGRDNGKGILDQFSLVFTLEFIF
jgi:hypothetical protein